MATGPAKPEPFAVDAAGVTLAGETVPAQDPSAPSIVLVHGLTATRRYVVHGSRVLSRRGYRLVSYDARGHGESQAAPAGTYDYEHLTSDLQAVVEAEVGEGRVLLAGHSMGAHTIAALALANPDRIAAIALAGPGVVGAPPSEESLANWEALAQGLEHAGVEGFLAAYEGDLDPAWRETILRFTRERLGAHRHLDAVAQALREVPRSIPFEGLRALEGLDVPALVVASHDTADPGHPYAVAEAWAESLPSGRLISEEPGESPLAWQGGRLSRAIADFFEAYAFPHG